WRPEIDYLPTVLTGPWTQVEKTITLADDFRVVLHHHDGVLILLQMVQNLHETAAIARVQADTRLIQDVQGIDQRRPQRRGQIDALHLAPREGARLAIERQVVQAHIDHVLQPTDDFSEQQRDSLVVAIRFGQVAKERIGIAYGHGIDLGNVLPSDARQQRLSLQAAAVAPGAGDVAAVLGQENPDVHTIRARLQPGE